MQNTPYIAKPTPTRMSRNMPKGCSPMRRNAASNPAAFSGSWVRAAHTIIPPSTANAAPRPT